MANIIDPTLLVQSWTHSHEEDTPSERVFRPATFKFAPSRGRRSFQLGAGGELRDGVPGPDDRPVASTGQWRLVQPDQLELVPSGAGASTEQLKVVSVAPDKLVVAK
jgi:hypothetical protein